MKSGCEKDDKNMDIKEICKYWKDNGNVCVKRDKAQRENYFRKLIVPFNPILDNRLGIFCGNICGTLSHLK